LSDEVLIGDSGPTSHGYHAIESFVRCGKEGQLRHIRGIRMPQAETPPHFAIGIIMHAGRKLWFGRGFRTDDAMWQEIKAEAEKECETQKLPVTADSMQKGLRYITEYIEHWSKFPKPRVKAVEHLVGPVAVTSDAPDALRTARLDDVAAYAEAGWGNCIGEAKTTSASCNEVVRTYELHGQPLLQHVLYRLDQQQGAALLGPATGTMLDIIHKGYGKEKSKFMRAFVPVTEFAIQWFAKDMAKVVRRANKMTWNTDARRVTTSCMRAISGRAGGCEFKQLCLHGAAATGKYVMGEEGVSLKSWKPTEERKVPPWA
jgi:hypothetical protein